MTRYTDTESLCAAAEAFQQACNDLSKCRDDIAGGVGGSAVLQNVEDAYHERYMSLSRAIFYARKNENSKVCCKLMYDSLGA